MKIGNFFIRLILSSPLHKLISKNTLLIHFTGRKSGKQYSTPVNYTQEGSTIRITSQRERLWWRNLKQAPAVSLHLRGKLVGGTAAVLESPADVASGLERFLRPAPDLARYYQISMDESGSFDQADLVNAARSAVVIAIVLDPIE
jgi:deazaflavin-dependent oxidoreductase (nitroreductase family)